MELKTICVITLVLCWCSATHDEPLQLLGQHTHDETLQLLVQHTHDEPLQLLVQRTHDATSVAGAAHTHDEPLQLMGSAPMMSHFNYWGSAPMMNHFSCWAVHPWWATSITGAAHPWWATDAAHLVFYSREQVSIIPCIYTCMFGAGLLQLMCCYIMLQSSLSSWHLTSLL